VRPRETMADFTETFEVSHWTGKAPERPLETGSGRRLCPVRLGNGRRFALARRRAHWMQPANPSPIRSRSSRGLVLLERGSGARETAAG
jgi:hypothetical protein